MTRRLYDAVAADYARLLTDLAAEAPADRALLDAFATEVRGRGAVVTRGACMPYETTPQTFLTARRRSRS